MKIRCWFWSYAISAGVIILWLILGATRSEGAVHIQSLSVQKIPSFIYSWGWHLVAFSVVDAEPGRYVIEESYNLEQWRICAECDVPTANTMLLMIQQDLGGAYRFYRIKLDERIRK